MIRVLHLIQGLERGGAEGVLVRLVAGMDRERFDSNVVSLTTRGPLTAALENAGATVEAIDLTGPSSLPRALLRLRDTIRRHRPDVVQTWMYHADLLGGLAARASGVRSVAWGVRSSDLLPDAFRRSTVYIARTCARLSSRLPAVIVCGSEAACRFHSRIGYDESRLIVIPNGYELLPPDPVRRAVLRTEMGVEPDAVLIGRVGRFHPHKDYESFVSAARLVAQRVPTARFLLCGAGLTAENDQLMSWVRASGYADRFVLLGERPNVDDVHRALDVACSSSIGEGFPNIVAEAMAAAVPVVSTDVGDAALIVGDTGRLVPAQDAAALAEALAELAAMPARDRDALGRAAQGRIAERYGIDRMIDAFTNLYLGLAGADTARR